MDSDQVSELVERLRYFNEWRRGAETEMPDPKQIGEDIDAAIDIISQVRELWKSG